MIVEAVIFIITVIVVYFLYTYKKIHYHLDQNGIKYLPGVPFFGNAFKSVLEKRHIFHDMLEVYKAFPEEKYVAYIEATTPIILVRDPELIKKITVKDFDHFVDHKDFFPVEVDMLLGGSVFGMKGDRWRDMRTTLSPAFTGSKMRLMMPFMDEMSHNIIEYLKDNLNKEMDLLDLFRRYTNDVIASAGFGLQVNSLVDRNNEFYQIGRTLFEFDVRQKLLFLGLGMFPDLVKLMGLQLYPKSTRDFFSNVVSSTIKYRETNHVERPDMINLLMEASKGTLKSNANENDDVGFAAVNEELKSAGKGSKWTMDEIIGQVVIFFAAGYDTSSSSLINAVHELAINPDVQEKLYQEVREFKERREKMTYDNINELKYMDCVLNESFRKWSQAIIMDRTCTKAYDLPPPRDGGKPYRLKVGEVVYNMVNAVHMDPKYYPDPDKFDPERFSDENKSKLTPSTFMPFGAGPRNCIGSRFAILEIKVLLYYLILNFKVLKCPKTTDPLEMDPAGFSVRPKGGSFVTFASRN